MNPCHTSLYYSLFQKFDAFSQALGRTLLFILRALFEPCELVRSPSGVRPIWSGLTGRQWFWVLLPKQKGLGCRAQTRQLLNEKFGWYLLWSSLRLYSWMPQHAKSSFAKVFLSFTPWANEAISFLSIKLVKDPLSGSECLSAIHHENSALLPIVWWAMSYNWWRFLPSNPPASILKHFLSRYCIKYILFVKYIKLKEEATCRPFSRLTRQI